MYEDVISRVYVVIERFFHLPSGSVNEEMSSVDIDRWDSLNNALILLDFEREFGIRIDYRVIRRAKNIGELAALINNIQRSSSL